jgi:dihydroorotase
MATNEILISSPFDAHVHFRQGEMLRHVVPLTVATFSGALVMPNTDPIVATLDQAVRYRREILEAAGSPQEERFRAFVTLFFQTSMTLASLHEAAGFITSVKFYPKSMTTNSVHGVDPDDPAILPVLAAMEELDIPLNVHAEAAGYHEDREKKFGRYVRRWVRSFPRLKIVVEHISDRQSLELLSFPNVYATVTPQHLLLTGDDWVGPPLRPHLYCLPAIKRPEDRDDILRACTSWLSRKFMAGTDSAPHIVSRKLECGCAGVFTAPIALQLYAQAFDRVGSLDRLPFFLGGNARRIYGIDLPERTVRLVREPFVVPVVYGDVVPMWAGETLDWSVA